MTYQTGQRLTCRMYNSDYVVVSSKENTKGTYTIGAGGMQKDTLEYTLLHLESKSLTELSSNMITNWYAFDENLMSQEEIDRLIEEGKAEAIERKKQEKIAREAADKAYEEFKEELAKVMPEGTKAVIVAQLDKNESDTQSDYFHASTAKTVILGFSKHTRNLFSEMRKHCAHFEPTAHLAENNKEHEHRENYSMGAGYYLKDGGRYSDGWTVKKINLYNRGVDGCPAGEINLSSVAPKGSKRTAAAVVGGARIEQHAHTKKGFEMFLVIPTDRLERDEFNAKRDAAKELDGWYSRAWGKTPGGFAFKDQEVAKQFAAEQFGGNGGDDTPPKGTNVAEKFEEMANKLESKINDCFADRQTNTPKRQAQARRAENKGIALKRTQLLMQKLAEAHRDGNVPPALADIKTKAACESLMVAETETVPNGFHPYEFDTGTPKNDDEATLAAWALIDGRSTEEDDKKLAIKRAEDSVKFSKIPGYFPTPKDVIKRMIKAADIGSCDLILEPSAGHGAIVDGLVEAGFDTGLIHCCEINATLREILALKGYLVVADDFLGKTNHIEYCKILMNPPYECHTYVEHICEAYEKMLILGGTLVAIVPNNYSDYFPADLYAAVREEEEIPAGAFKEAGTNIATCMIVLDK